MESKYIPYNYEHISQEKSLERAKSFYEQINKRRSVRHFSNKEVSEEVINNIIMTASSAPSGAHKQPWTFCAVSNPELKSIIRKAAEEEGKVGGGVDGGQKIQLVHLRIHLVLPQPTYLKSPVRSGCSCPSAI